MIHIIQLQTVETSNIIKMIAKDGNWVYMLFPHKSLEIETPAIKGEQVQTPRSLSALADL